MRKKIIALLLCVCLAAGFLSMGSASGTVYFTAVNNTLLELRADRMPKYYGGDMYLPVSVFASASLFSIGGVDTLMIYKGEKKLTFTVSTGMTQTEDGLIYDHIPAKLSSGAFYVPARAVCDYFGLQYELASADPAPVVRIISATNVINIKTFIGLNRQNMQAAYDAYYVPAQPSGSPGATPPVTDPAVTPTGPVSYAGITLQPCFFGFEGEALGDTLAALDPYVQAGYRVTFYLTERELLENAVLVRALCGAGHSVGIRLQDGDFEEYRRAAALLFDAAMVRTALVCAPGPAEDAAQVMAGENGLAFHTFSRTASGRVSVASVTGALPTAATRQILGFSCEESVIRALPGIFAYIQFREYTVARVTEITGL